LSGSYPAPTVARVNGAALGTTTPVARGDLLVANATPALARLALGANGTVLQSNGTDAIWATPPGGAPSGAASGDLSGTYPGPTVARVNGAALGTTTPVTRGDILVANATPVLARLAKGATGQVLSATATDTIWQALTQSQFPVAPNGLLTTNINDAQVTVAKLAAGASNYSSAFGNSSGGQTIGTTEVIMVDLAAPGFTTGRLLILLGMCSVSYANASATPGQMQLSLFLKWGGAAGAVAGTSLVNNIFTIGCAAWTPGTVCGVIPWAFTPTTAPARLKLTAQMANSTIAGATLTTDWSPSLMAFQFT